jgi:hypothetical protein
MSDSLVVIRNFGNLLQADEAQIELLNAGIYSLLMSDETGIDALNGRYGIALAVHRRDAEVAHAVLAPLADTA